jgi:hypothetical protein
LKALEKSLVVGVFLIAAAAIAAVAITVLTLRSGPDRHAQAVVYAQAVSTALDRGDLVDVQKVSGAVWLAVFPDACYLVDLHHPALDIKTKCPSRS